MNEEQFPETSPNENGLKQSILIKIGLIAALTLILLIPSNWIQSMIYERQTRQDEVITEISDKWAGSQLVEGPVMVIPYKIVTSRKDTAGKLSYKETITNIYILPENLDIESEAVPEILHRGVFDAVVYNSVIKVSGKFSPLELKKSGIDPAMVFWDKTKIVIGLSDLKGLKNNPIVTLANVQYAVEPDFTSLKLFTNNLIILPDLNKTKNSSLDFSFNLNLRGSSELTFSHLGKTTSVKVKGKWNTPSFTGRYLPDTREISGEDFNATWKLPYFYRIYPQQWVEENAWLHRKTSEAVFGVKFILPVDQYQKTMRSAKYAVLIIALSFISLFFTELLYKKKIHVLQYGLIGISMTIYYILLLSFSEQVGFNLAYLIASCSTIALVGSFIASLMKNKKPAFIYAAILGLLYGFIYVIIQLQDFALLFGSIGIFIIVAALMKLSAKIDWDKREQL